MRMKILLILLDLLIVEKCSCFLALLKIPFVSLTRFTESLFDGSNTGEDGSVFQSIEKTVRQITDDNDIQSEKTPSEKFILIYEVILYTMIYHLIEYCYCNAAVGHEIREKRIKIRFNIYTCNAVFG